MELFFLALLILIMASALASGYPVAFSLPGAAIITISLAALAGWLFAGNPDAYFHQGGPGQWLSAGVTNFRGIYWEVERDTLIAIPLFIFMGIMLQRSKIAEDLLVTMAQLFGPVPGGLGISVVFVGALLAATTGILGATVVAMGLISLPAMLRNKYSTPLATGTIAASGTLGQIIPPSIVLIILADQLSSAVDQASNARKTLYKATTGEVSMPSEFSLVSASAGDMFLGALIPGLVLVGLYMLYIFITALIKPEKAPAVPFEGTYDRKFAAKVSITLVPPLTLIFVVLGSILLGVATVNQAGAIGAIGAMIMAGYRLKEGEKNAYTPAIIAIASLIVIGVTLSLFETNVKSETSSGLGITIAAIAVVALLIAVIWSGWRTLKIEDTLKGVMIETAKTTSLVFIILLGAAMLTAAFRAFGGEELVREFLTSLPGGFWAQFFIVMLVIFLLGFFLDFIEIAVVVVPIVAPILLSDPSANITAVWLGVMIGMNIQTSFLTPPFGFALFYLRGVAPAIVKTIDMYKGVIPFIALQLLALAIVGLVPPLANYLPARVSMLSETAPPPLNPRLQYCIEEFLFDDYQAEKQTLTAAISEAQAIDLSYLPKKERKALEDAFERAGTIYALLDDISTAEAARDAAIAGYKPLHTSVRRIESQIRRVESDLKANDGTLQRLKRNASSDPQRIERLQKRVDSLTTELEALKAQVPANWEERHKAFAELQNADASARKKYRTTADRSYDPVRSALKELEGETDWDALAGKIAGLKAIVDTEEPKQASKLIGDVGKEVGRAAGGKAIKKEIDKARKLARARKPDPEKTKAAIDEALAVLEEEKAWRARAQAELLPSLQKYEETIRDTIGLRLQPKLSRDQALKVAACNSNHRDLSLSF